MPWNACNAQQYRKPAKAAARHAAEVRVAELEARVRALEGTPEPSDAS